MKKTILALFAVLLVLFLASCSGGDEEEEVSEEGMATLSISVDGGAGRALVGTNAETLVDHFEVVFKAGDNYYKAEFDNTQGSVQIHIPARVYNGVSEAVLFGGYSTSSTLLAVGAISMVDAVSYTGGANASIAPSSTSVTFLMSPLTNGVINNTTSTFLITGPTEFGDGDNYATLETLNGAGAIQVAGGFPVFPIPTGNPITGTTASDFANTTANTIGVYKINIPNNGGVKISTAWTATATPASAGTEVAIAGTVTCYPQSPTSITYSGGTTGVFTFMVDTTSAGATDGLCAVLIEAPVGAIGIAGTAATVATTSPGTSGTLKRWYIRGGIDPGSFDGINGNGAAVLLGIGTKYGKFDASPWIKPTY